MKEKKAQLKIQQMSFMLIAVFVFFMLVLLFYLVISLSGLKNTAKNLESDRVAGMITKIASTPELIFEDQPYSIDADKLMVLKNQPNYLSFLGINGLTVERVYPKVKGVECSLGNYPECDTIKLFTDNEETESANEGAFVALCRKVSIEGRAENKCELARLLINIKPVGK
jgi:hypothetical protein